MRHEAARGRTDELLEQITAGIERWRREAERENRSADAEPYFAAEIVAAFEELSKLLSDGWCLPVPWRFMPSWLALATRPGGEQYVVLPAGGDLLTEAGAVHLADAVSWCPDLHAVAGPIEVWLAYPGEEPDSDDPLRAWQLPDPPAPVSTPPFGRDEP